MKNRITEHISDVRCGQPLTDDEKRVMDYIDVVKPLKPLTEEKKVELKSYQKKIQKLVKDRGITVITAKEMKRSKRNET